MTNFRKVVSSLLTLSTALTLSGVGMISTASGLQLKNASVSLSDSQPSVSAVYTITFKAATAGNVGSVRFLFSNAATGAGVPTGLSTNASTITSVNIPASDTGSWSVETVTPTQANGTINLKRSSATSVASNATFTFVLGGITNNSQSAACDPVANSDSCWIQMTTYSDTGFASAVDNTTATYTVVDPVTVTATVDPIMRFTVAGVTSGSFGDGVNGANLGTGTQVTSTVTTLPFGNVTVGTAKIAQQALTTQTNANNGYSIYGKFITAGNEVMVGNASGSNNIDKFTASSASWTVPQLWGSPTGTTANVNAAWLGVRSSDADISQFTSDKWGPPDVLNDSGSGKVVMTSTLPDNGTSPVYVTFKIEANAFQPADQYTGTWAYNAVPSY